MEVSISARHGNLGKEDQSYIEKKLPKLTHLFGRITSIAVTVDFRKPEPQVELLVSAEHKNDFVAREHHSSVAAAFDNAIAKMEGQLRRSKEKLQDRHRRPAEPEGVIPEVSGGEEA